MIWAEDWAWGALSSVALIFFHVSALFVMSMFIFHDRIVRLRSRSLFVSILMFSLLGTAAVLLHALEAAGWAALYWRLGVVDDYADALLHSLGAYSTMGDETITFEKKWRLMLPPGATVSTVSLIALRRSFADRTLCRLFP